MTGMNLEQNIHWEISSHVGKHIITIFLEQVFYSYILNFLWEIYNISTKTRVGKSLQVNVQNIFHTLNVISTL